MSTTSNLTGNLRFGLIFTFLLIGWLSWLYLIEDNPEPLPPSTSKSFINFFMQVYGLVYTTWIGRLYFNNEPVSDRASKPVRAGLFFHLVPMLCLLATNSKLETAKDSGLVLFSALITFRYWRTLVSWYFWTQYQITPSRGEGEDDFLPSDCTVIVPTVGPVENSVFDDMVKGILMNRPKCLIFSTNKEVAQIATRSRVELVKNAMIQDRQYPGDVTEIVYENANFSNKRRQVVHGFNMVRTDILAMADDTAIWHPKFLQATLPAFNDKDVGLVGTRKWVNRIADQNGSHFARIWNMIGALYLVRHNWEIRASNTADGGVFCVSGRSSLIRSSIIQREDFAEAFTNEYAGEFVYTWLNSLATYCGLFRSMLTYLLNSQGLCPKGFGPLNADDDNFVTRWVINRGFNIKIQYSPEATMMTVLGQTKPKLKFLDQCRRWARTTFRQNPVALFIDCTLWSKWPLTVWTTYFPWMYNAALFWDSMSIWSFTKTGFYNGSSYYRLWLVLLILLILSTKLIKTYAWFQEHPEDRKYIPFIPVFSYFHSFVKTVAAVSWFDNSWSGRDLTKEPTMNQQTVATED
ncbi:glycosyltransferase family 2 protein [Stemphylium lycopersici]|nr:glycosyltransferase family 2 protein [Stemphylium lycopersici]RAR07519.1 glycosyltransferase family 2 protein [Stemphylium lycopersici]